MISNLRRVNPSALLPALNLHTQVWVQITKLVIRLHFEITPRNIRLGVPACSDVSPTLLQLTTCTEINDCHSSWRISVFYQRIDVNQRSALKAEITPIPCKRLQPHTENRLNATLPLLEITGTIRMTLFPKSILKSNLPPRRTIQDPPPSIQNELLKTESILHTKPLFHPLSTQYSIRPFIC